MLLILEKVCGADIFYVEDEQYHLQLCEGDDPMMFLGEVYDEKLKSLCWLHILYEFCVCYTFFMSLRDVTCETTIMLWSRTHVPAIKTMICPTRPMI